MAKIAKKLIDLVGNTPLMELSGTWGIEARRNDNRTDKRKYRCRTGNGRYHQRISPDIDNA